MRPILALGAAVVLLAAACTEADTEATDSQEDRTLVVATPSLPVSLDPTNIPGQQTAEIQGVVYWPMTVYEAEEGPDGIPYDQTDAGEEGMQPGALESWEASDDGTTWTLTLRDDIVDSFGNPVRAEEFLWILRRCLLFPGGCISVLNTMGVESEDQFEIVDDLSVQITLPSPSPIFLRLLHSNVAAIFGAGTAMEQATDDDPWAAEWLERNAPAIGPYQVETFRPGEEMVLVKNPNWFGEEPEIDRILYRQVPESSSRVALLLAGDAHIARDLSQEELERVDASDNARAVCAQGNQFGYLPLKMDDDSPIATDVRVRRALAHAIPVDELVQGVYKGRGDSFQGMLLPHYPNFLGEEAYPYTYDVERARSLLEEAGAENLDVTLTVAGDQPEHERMAVIIKDAWEEIGVNTTIDRKPRAAFNDAVFNREWSGGVIDQNYSLVLDAVYHSFVWQNPQPPPNLNYGGWNDPEFESLQDRASTLPAGPERDETVAELQDRFIEQIPQIPLVNIPTCFGFANEVQSYVWHLSNQVLFSDLRFE